MPVAPLAAAEPAATPHTRVAIVGAGFGGPGAAIRLTPTTRARRRRPAPSI